MSPSSELVFIGLDLGTQGVRCVAVTPEGEVTGQAERPLAPTVHPQPGHSEQDPLAWWQACTEALQALVAQVRPHVIGAISVDSTSGTFLLVGRDRRPLTPAIMYNDQRAGAEAQQVAPLARDFTARCGYGFPATFALPKLLWVKRHWPHRWEQTTRVLSAADWVVLRLTGCLCPSDWSNMLKLGYDLIERRWPAFLDTLGLSQDRLPEVVAPGNTLGRVGREGAEQTGLPEGTLVVAGCTDGTASLLASGVSRPGEVNSTLGTTLALRGVSDRLVRDLQGRVYCHLHPDGYWLPGGASNTGARPLAERFGERALREDTAAAVAAAPYATVVYPLSGRGERMPFASSEAEAVVVQADGERPGQEQEVGLGAWLQGQALVERWCFELLEELGAPVGDWAAATGGAAANDAWLQLRADVLGRQLKRPRHAFAAYGAALLAMAGYTGRKVSELGRELVEFEITVDPTPGRADVYGELLDRLKQEIRRRGWW